MEPTFDRSELTKDALIYHSGGRPGKIEVKPTKPYHTQRDLSLAYSPGVAQPCLEIQANPEDIYKYTAKGNLVAVISNGTAVLGLGNIGADAGKPVMEGKGLLFKIYADIDVFDIEINEKDPDKVIEIVKAISPTFGGINLEDIKAPECFYIEERLKEELNIPLMHDDQHGTAIITSAGLLNALEITGKNIDKVRVVVNGAGASAISCTSLYVQLGVKKENVLMFDSKGLIHNKRTDLNNQKLQFATHLPPCSLEEALVGADVFLGLSIAGALKKEWLKGMAHNPIVFALANPTPEIGYFEAKEIRPDTIIGTGRSDFPNQVNNVLGFPYIFRGALDVRASKINESMKLAAARALSLLAKEPVPDEVLMAYGLESLKFGPDYIIPKPTDPRLIERVAPAVAKAAIESGVAKVPITDWQTYIDNLQRRMGHSNPLIRHIRTRAQQYPQRILFAEAENYKILKAAEIVKAEGIAVPILMGNRVTVNRVAKEHEINIDNLEIIDCRSDEECPRKEKMALALWKQRQRKGLTITQAIELMQQKNYFGSMLVNLGEADGMISGLTNTYPQTVRPALQVIGKKPEWSVVSGMYILSTIKGMLFFADTTVNMNPNVSQLVEITLQSAEAVRNFGYTPRVAIVSYSNYGSVKGRVPNLVQEAVAILHKNHPELIVDGDIQADFALNPAKLKEHFPFSKLAEKGANTLIFPYLTAANTAYKLVKELTDQDPIGPVLNGLNKSVHILQMGSTVSEIVNMATIAAVDSIWKKGLPAGNNDQILKRNERQLIDNQ